MPSPSVELHLVAGLVGSIDLGEGEQVRKHLENIGKLVPFFFGGGGATGGVLRVKLMEIHSNGCFPGMMVFRCCEKKMQKMRVLGSCQMVEKYIATGDKTGVEVEQPIRFSQISHQQPVLFTAHHAPSWWKFTRKGIRSILNDKSHVPKSMGEL